MNNSKFSCTLALLMSVLLCSCGGDSSNSFSSDTEHEDSDWVKRMNYDRPEDTTALLPESEMPSVPKNLRLINDMYDKSAIEALKKGVYTYEGTTTISLYDRENNITDSINGVKVIDCPQNGKDSCDYFSEYKLENNKIISRKFAFQHKLLTMVELDGGAHGGNLEHPMDYDDFRSDGKMWSNDVIDLNDMSAQVLPNKLSYKVGDAEFDLYGIGENISKGLVSTHSSGAKKFNYKFKLTKGTWISFDDGYGHGDYHDDEKYNILASFFNNHVSQYSPLCFTEHDNKKSIIFSHDNTASLYHTGESCRGDIEGQIEVLTTGVKTIAGKQVLFMEQPRDGISLNKTGNEQQFVWAFSLSDEGKPMQGKAYQKGYVSTENKYFYNQQAIIDVINENRGLQLVSLFE